MTLPQISLAPVFPTDLLLIAKLEAAAFATEDFSAIAFGPNRFSDAAMASHASELAQGPKPGEKLRNVKAVITLPDVTEEIVGFANWTICTGRTGSEEEMRSLGTKEGWAEREREREGKGEEKDPWGLGTNVRFCEDAFVKGDEHMARATRGKDYAKLFCLVVSPKYQRRGIGAVLFKAFLKEADEAGLQSILGASPDGIELYRKHGFVDFETTDFKLWEYEGGEGMGIARHVIMHRPAVSRGSAK